MLNKPDWKDAPEWAQWVAQDADGDWMWYETKPYPIGDMWVIQGSGRSELVSIENSAWEDTLKERPKASPQS